MQKAASNAFNGYLDGSLDLDVVNLAFADALVEFGLINKRDKRKLLLLGGLGAALGGDTQDRLSLPLRFQNGFIWAAWNWVRRPNGNDYLSRPKFGLSVS